jgi:hypothetical protein
LKNDFLNHTIATIPPADNNEKGDNAAWDNGHFLKQITLIQIVGADNSLKYIREEIAEAYRLRWRQEMCFDDLKTTLHMAHLKSKTPSMAQKELCMFLIAHNLLRCLMAQAAAQSHIQIEQISFKGTLDAFRQCSQGMAQAKSKAKREVLWEEFNRILAADILPQRPGRREPRAVKRIIKYPKLNCHRRRFKDRMSRNKRRSLKLRNAKSLI